MMTHDRFIHDHHDHHHHDHHHDHHHHHCGPLPHWYPPGYPYDKPPHKVEPHDFVKFDGMVETDRTFDLFDDLKTMHFRVKFYITRKSSPERCPFDVFNVEVLSLVKNCCHTQEEFAVIFHEEYEDRNTAVDVFNKKLHQYDSLVKSMRHDFDDVNLYKEGIGYHKICPDCCFNCHFCRNSKDGYHLKCTNHVNFAFFSELLQKTHNMDVINLEPRVDVSGICKNFEPRTDHDPKLMPPIPRSFDIHMHRTIDRKIGQAMDELEFGIIEANSGDSSTIV